MLHNFKKWVEIREAKKEDEEEPWWTGHDSEDLPSPYEGDWDINVDDEEESEPYEPEMGEPSPDHQGTFNLDAVGRTELHDLGSKAVFLFQNYINGAADKGQALKTIKRMIINALSINEGILSKLFGKYNKPSQNPGVLFQRSAPEQVSVSDNELWGIVEELVKDLLTFYGGKRVHVEQHLANLLNQAYRGAGRDMIKAPKIKKPPQPPLNQGTLF